MAYMPITWPWSMMGTPGSCGAADGRGEAGAAGFAAEVVGHHHLAAGKHAAEHGVRVGEHHVAGGGAPSGGGSSFQDRSVMAWIFSPGLPSTGTTSPISA